MSLSTHVLDTNIGRPAAGIALTLYEFRPGEQDGDWLPVGSGRTDADGRCSTLLGEHPMIATNYKLVLDTGAYFSARQSEGLYPLVEIAFTVRNPQEHYHIPLLLTANGYTTYRGS